MVLYQGMYNVAHFEINNNLQLYEDVLVGDEYDYKRLRKICFVSGSVYINKAIVNGSEIKGGAHVTIQDESIFVNIVPENESDGIVIGITFYLNENGDMYAYTEKRDGGPTGTIVESFNGRTGQVVPANTDYNAGMIGYDNTVSQLIAENTQDAIDEVAQDLDNIQDEIEDLDAEHIAYDNSTSHLLATNTQRAIDELDNDLQGKQNALTFDNEPTAASLNPVTSDGILHAIESVDVGVTSFNGRDGAVTPAASDYDADQIDYDATQSHLAADDVQEAIDIVAGLVDDLDEDKIEKPASASQGDVLTFDGTDWVAGQIQSGVSSFNSRTGAVTPAAHDYDADQIDYDNSVSQLTATDVQAALDEIAHDVLTSGVASFNSRTGAVLPVAHDYEADQVDYDNTNSGLAATDVQAAIDEVLGQISGSGVSSFNSRTGAVVPAVGDYDADKIEIDGSTTSIPGTVDTVQEFLEWAYPPIVTVTITLTLNGGYEDTIVIKDSDDNTVGTCVFPAGATSGTFTTTVDSGYSDSWTFTSATYKVSETDYFSKTVTVDDTALQTVNCYPDGATVWYGNLLGGTFSGDYDATFTQQGDAILGQYQIPSGSGAVNFSTSKGYNLTGMTKAHFIVKYYASSSPITLSATVTNPQKPQSGSSMTGFTVFYNSSLTPKTTGQIVTEYITVNLTATGTVDGYSAIRIGSGSQQWLYAMWFD